MSGGTRFDQWQLLLVPFPFSDLSGVKRRPAIIVSNSDFNHSHDDVVCCMVTSHLDDEPGCPVINEKDLASGVLPFASKIKPYRLFTLEKSVVVRTLGVLGAKKAEETRQELLFLLGLA